MLLKAIKKLSKATKKAIKRSSYQTIKSKAIKLVNHLAIQS